MDVVIFGGGVSGLWTLDALRRAGWSCVLLEAHELGAGQTVGSQGIIHGGLKYTLAGALTRSAEAIRDMPAVWRDALAGRDPQHPDLSRTKLRSEHCWLWRTGKWSSRLGMVGARVGLRVKPVRVDKADWPGVLAGVGDVFRLEEQVVSPVSMIETLAGLHPDCVVKYDEATLALETRGEQVSSVRFVSGETRHVVRCRAVVLTAGLGNAALREAAGITQPRMQRRGVHMILARETQPGSGALPALNGHCVDGNKTRVTVTSDTDTQGRTVWQVGGQVSEDGTVMSRDALLRHALREVSASLGGRDLGRGDPGGVEWATYFLDKAEVTTDGGLRPDDAFVEQRGNVLTCWPTKLALAPRLAALVGEALKKTFNKGSSFPEAAGVRPHPFQLPEADLERPRVASPPWEQDRPWTPSDRVLEGASC